MCCEQALTMRNARRLAVVMRSRLSEEHQVRAGGRGVGRGRRGDVIGPGARLTGTGSHVTARGACRVDARVVDVAVEQAEDCACADQHQQNDETDIHRTSSASSVPCRVPSLQPSMDRSVIRKQSKSTDVHCRRFRPACTSSNASRPIT